MNEDNRFFEVLFETFPYPIQVYDLEGTLIFINSSSLKLFNIDSKDCLVGKFNILKDPIMEKWGINVRQNIIKSFRGEVIYFNNLKVPVQSIEKRFDYSRGNHISFQSILCYPIFDDNHKVTCVANVFVASSNYEGRDEITEAEEYIKKNCKNKFSLSKISDEVGFSKSYFSNLFKKYTGKTPYNCYIETKMNMIKDKIASSNLTISDVFSYYGLEYNGYYAKIFKKQIGCSPMQYRKSLEKIK
jgi:AraC-like DNA-binding protein